MPDFREPNASMYSRIIMPRNRTLPLVAMLMLMASGLSAQTHVFPALDTNNQFTGIQTFAKAFAQNFENILFADQFQGSNIGAKINSAYAALPSNGGVIYVTTGGTFSTAISLGTPSLW